jgi:hypothetical protein
MEGAHMSELQMENLKALREKTIALSIELSTAIDNATCHGIPCFACPFGGNQTHSCGLTRTMEVLNNPQTGR